MTQPTLATERLILDPFKGSDLQDLFDYASDPKVAETTAWETHRTLADSQAYFDWIQKKTCLESEGLFIVWAVREKASRKVIGSIDFKNIYSHSGQFDYALGRNYWNKGYATEAAQKIVYWAQQTNPGLVRIQSNCIASNFASRRVMEKVGLELECIRKKSLFSKGQILDTAHYAMVK